MRTLRSLCLLFPSFFLSFYIFLLWYVFVGVVVSLFVWHSYVPCTAPYNTRSHSLLSASLARSLHLFWSYEKFVPHVDLDFVAVVVMCVFFRSLPPDLLCVGLLRILACVSAYMCTNIVCLILIFEANSSCVCIWSSYFGCVMHVTMMKTMLLLLLHICIDQVFASNFTCAACVCVRAIDCVYILFSTYSAHTHNFLCSSQFMSLQASNECVIRSVRDSLIINMSVCMCVNQSVPTKCGGHVSTK